MSNSENNKLVKFIYKRQVQDTTKFNLQSIRGPDFGGGKFYIKNKTEFNKFVKYYNDYCFIQKKNCYFLEPPFNIKNLFDFDNTFNNHNLLKIDLDFKYNYDEELDKTNKSKLLEHKYTKKQIKSIISLYLTELGKYVKFDKKPNFTTENNTILKDLDIILMERSSAYISVKNNTKNVKDGIHIIIPKYVFPHVILKKVRNSLIKNKEFINIIKEIGQKNSVDDVLDESVITKNAWFLYGSRKPLTKPYLITQVYKFKEIKNKEYKFMKIKNLDTYIKDTRKLIHNLSCFGVKQTVLPIDDSIINILSNEININEQNLANQEKNNFNKILGIKNDIDYSNISISKPESPSITLDFLNKILSCLKDERASKYEDWWKIGQALYNIDWVKGLSAFRTFSMRCPEKYSPQTCGEFWRIYERNHMNNKYQFNIKFLKELASTDNKVKFNKISNYITMTILNGIIDIFRQPIYAKKIGDSTLSQEIKKLIDSDNTMHFVAIPDKHWYYYSKHKWIFDVDGNVIKLYIKNKILSIFKKYYSNCCEKNKNIQNKIDTIKLNEVRQESQQNRINDIDDLINCDSNILSEGMQTLEMGRQNIQQMQIDQSVMEERMRVSHRLITYLEDSAKRSNLVKELATEFCNDDFYSMLDNNFNVFHCKNGVLDLEAGVFRDGVPDDMITISSNNNYISDEIRFGDEEYLKYNQELDEFLDKILPIREMKEFMMNVWALGLSGKCMLQTFNVCTGTGSNGKSVNFELLTEVFGEYFCTASPALLTKGRKDANCASPALAALIGKRIVCCEEPDENEPIKTGVMKDAVSGTPMKARPLYKPDKTFLPQYILFFNCNDKPDITATDEGTWRRVRVCPYISKFCDPRDSRLNNPKYKYHFAKEKTIKDKFCHWKEVFLNELFRRFLKLKENNYEIPLPKLVLKAIDEYKAGHNIYETFKRECLNKTSGSKVTVVDIFELFKNYASQCNQMIKNINRNTFVTEMSRVIGKTSGRSNNKYWKDYEIIVHYDDEDDDDGGDQEDEDDDDQNNSDSD